MEIITFGVGGRLRRCAALLAGVCSGSGVSRIILLPIPSTRDGTLITGTEFPLEEILSSIGTDTMIAGYGIPGDIVKRAKKLGAYVYDASLDEDFLMENAEITAHGTLGHILSDFTEDISEMKIGIIGYGRIGSALLRLLLFVGAEVRVYTTRAEVAKSLGEDGVLCETVSEETDWTQNDLIINTAPAKLIREELLSGELKNVKIIELASGKNFSEQPNITRMPSIPEKMYPETAGKIYAKQIIRALSEVAK